MKTFKQFRPYIKRIRVQDGLSIYRVDGKYIRDHIDNQFTDFGQHYQCSYIPIDELWVDIEVDPGELEFYIAHLFTEYNMMRLGWDYDQALDEADEVERQLRKQHKPSKLYIRRLYKLKNHIEVWLVNGDYVRTKLFTDFTEGGHYKVYDFIHHSQIWIDDDLKPKERKYVLIHEYSELQMMLAGIDYERAHREASELESEYRKKSTKEITMFIKGLKEKR